jgi:DNA-binding NtrC family response regulator
LTLLLESNGYATFGAKDGHDALTHLARVAVPVVITDLRMPRMDGLTLLFEIERRGLPSAVLLLTGQGDIGTAVEAMRHGAHDYLTKPVDPNRLLRRVALATVRAPAAAGAAWRAGLVGTGAAMRGVFDLVERVAPSRASVLIVGESGTGKELLARTIHALSPRAAHRFVAVDGGALSPDGLEGELLGYDGRGVTAARIRTEGCVERADRGTLFLEEVAEATLATQATLFRILEDRAFRRAGGTQKTRVDARVIAATRRDIQGMLGDGRFRHDLYFCLSTVEIHVPPLRDRVEDVPHLVRSFLDDFSRMHDKDVRKVSTPAMDRLLRYSWPGNVRELRKAIEHAVIVAAGDTVVLDDLPTGVRDPGSLPGPTADVDLCRIDEMERRLIRAALARFPTRHQAARALGVSLRTLYNRIHRYGLGARDPRPPLTTLAPGTPQPRLASPPSDAVPRSA